MVREWKLIGRVGWLAAMAVAWGMAGDVWGQDPRSAGSVPLPSYPGGAFSHSYGSLDAGREAYAQAETRRREDIARQLGTVEENVWYSGVPGYYRYPPNLSSIYAYGWQGPLTARRAPGGGTYYYAPYDPQPSVFEPWPLVAGDIYGYPYLDRVDQPQGHEIIATGPNGYVYRPTYAPNQPAPPPPEPNVKRPPSEPLPAQPLPPKQAKPTPAPSPGPETIPTPPPVSGPREF